MLDLHRVGSVGERREQRDAVPREHVRLVAAVGVVLVLGAGEHHQQHALVRVGARATVRVKS